ncbi:Protein of unknown function [Cotesia congregata]|uniref:Uncharacterized protein n=1 Tax=Cotesia congregata TaxID=51543 RepID=A0A8J2EKA7_COTCN|nr:Protein of unknown function [Cotesia congregata]
MKKGYLKVLASGDYDINERNNPIANTNYKYTDKVTHYEEIKFSILTQKRTFDRLSIIVILSVAIFILIHNYFAFGVSLLDVFSLIFNMGIMTPLGRLSMRIMFVIASFFIFSTSSAIQDEISALLAGPSRYSIETLQNLYDHRYHVFYDQELHQDILNQNIWVTDDDKKFLHSSDYRELIFQCTKNVRQNSTIACIYRTSLQLAFMKKFPNLYMSKNPVFTNYYAPWTRKNWALKKKFDKIGQSVFDSGLMNYDDRKRIINRLKKIRKKERIKASEQMDEVTENDLIPTYKIFGVSLIIALLIFCVKIMIEKLSTHPKADHKQTVSRVEPKIVRSKRRKTLKKHKRNRNRRSWLP